VADAQGYGWSVSSLFRCFAKTGEEVNRVEIGAALIPSCGDRAGVVDGTALGPHWRKTPGDYQRSGEAQLRMGRKYLPRALRIKLYHDVVVLRKCGLTYGRVIEEVYRRHGVRISKSHISYWIRGIHNPYKGRRIPSIELLEPSEELAYVIGVVLGDGYVKKGSRVIKGYNDVTIGLKARDREFVEEFARCLASVLGRGPIRPGYMKSSGRYVVEARSETLYELLRKPVDLDGLKPYVEHCERCVAAFLRGFADSEGCVDKHGYIYIINTNVELLTYVKALLKRLNIESTGAKLCIRQGTIMRDPKTGKQYARNKDCYRIYIRTRSNTNFHKNIGFTIEKKQRRLEEYIKMKNKTLSGTFPNQISKLAF